MLYLPIQLLLCILPSFSILAVDKRTIYNNKSVATTEKTFEHHICINAFIHM